MNFLGYQGGLFKLFEWISKFAYVNVLWMAFSFIGLIIFGFFPATIAMFTIVRKWIMGDTDISIFKQFWSIYKQEFIKSNLLGLLLILVAGIIYVNLIYIEANTGNLLVLTHIPLYLFMFAFILTVIYLFPVYVHYDVKFFQMFKNSFLIMIINPIYTLMMILGIIGTYYGLSLVPGLIFFFGGSALTYIIMWPSYQAFQKVEKKKEKTVETNS
ncbi:DUF624 domain-containing protein [Aquibacillus halophilus]|uniref:DUF624 domain-containing protein n=1 Tax=Aquibacillus halophilus TaxID=930132 RepID=A0A6A8D8L0_9BACI|nr:YesL family protein [Aquibacillus halophilus]MRH41928.1 DUF624 domain-containing protein [Aquibacillus halophilus]